jgi:hypothetical protein
MPFTASRAPLLSQGVLVRSQSVTLPVLDLLPPPLALSATTSTPVTHTTTLRSLEDLDWSHLFSELASYYPHSCIPLSEPKKLKHFIFKRNKQHKIHRLQKDLIYTYRQTCRFCVPQSAHT